MVCLVLLMYLLMSVMSRLALMLSLSFGVTTTLLHQSVGSSPTSSMMSRLCHLSRIWSNFSFRGIDTPLCLGSAPGALGTTRSFTLTPFSFPIPVKTSSYSLIKSFISGCPTSKIGSLMSLAAWRLRSAVFPSLCTRHPLYSFGSGLGMLWDSWLRAIPVQYHLLSNVW